VKRQLDRLSDGVFDVVIVGGGIQGACLAADAATRGLRVALVEKGDFGAATSHNSLKLLHGGLRYLQHLDFPRVRQSIAERRFWLRAAPHLCRPLGFLMPLRGFGTRSRGALFAAMKLYDLLGYDRNVGVPAHRRIPSGRTLSRQELYELAPGMHAGYTSGALWHDGQMVDADRLLLACLTLASERGAAVANYVEMTRFRRRSNGSVEGIEARDVLSGREIDIRARQTVLAAGPWNISLLRSNDVPLGAVPKRLIKNMNLVVPRLFAHAGIAVGVESPHRSDSTVGNTNRLFFVTPWKSLSIIGTTHVPFAGEPDQCTFGPEDIAAFLGDFNAAYPARELTHHDVIYTYGGLTPGDDDDGSRRSRHGTVVDHQIVDDVPGLWTVTTVKYTTARWLAERAIDAVLERLGGRVPCLLPGTRLPGAEAGGDGSRILAELSAMTDLEPADLAEFAAAYGSRAPRVLERGGYRSGSGPAGLVLCRLRYAVREEMAVCAEDFLLRRTGLGIAGAVGDELKTDIDRVLAQELRPAAATTYSQGAGGATH
jgi:glycerol-3-phosphate dehydrogenase